MATKKTRIIRIRCSDSTYVLWRKKVLEYNLNKLTAEDLLLDGLKLVDEYGLPRRALVY